MDGFTVYLSGSGLQRDPRGLCMTSDATVSAMQLTVECLANLDPCSYITAPCYTSPAKPTHLPSAEARLRPGVTELIMSVSLSGSFPPVRKHSHELTLELITLPKGLRQP